MKKALLIISLFFIQNSFAQFKNFRIDTINNKVEVIKMYSDITTLNIEPHNTGAETLATTGVMTFLVGTIEKIPSYISQFLKKRKKKFMATYEAKNTIAFKTTNQSLPKLSLERLFYPKDSLNFTPAMKLILKPITIQGNTYFSYKIDTLLFKYSKARINKKAPHINLLIEITCTYAKIKDSTYTKTETKSSAIIIPVDLKKENQNEKIIQNQLTDAFMIQDLIEINVKVTEVNPYKLKLEDFETFLTDNNEDLSGLFKELSQLLKAE